MLNFTISNKSMYQRSEDGKKWKNQAGEEGQIALKMIEIRKHFQDNLPEIASQIEFVVDKIKNDFILMYFCPVESYAKCFQVMTPVLKKNS